MGLLPEVLEEVVPIGGSRFGLETISAEEWNDFCDRLERNLPIRYASRTVETGRHPWNVQARWNGDRLVWQLNVEAGFVNNGVHVEAPKMPLAIAPAATIERFAGKDVPPTDLVAPWLDESPWFDVPDRRFRKIGSDALALAGDAESVPDFFAALGVGDAGAVTVGPFGVETTLPVTPGQSRRLLRAVDLVLYQPRPALTTSLIDRGDGTARLEVSVFRAAARSEPPLLSVRSRFTPPFRANGFREVLAGLSDDPFDAIRIATVYLLSPAGEADGATVGPDWSPFVAHHVFKNLSHDVTIDLIPSASLGVVFLPLPLAGGVGQPLVDSIVDATSGAADQALQLLNRSRIDGMFWT
jgi:hypothetical protein